MRLLLPVLAALIVIAPATARAQKQTKKQDAPEGVTYVRADDPVMLKAKADARRTLPDFLAHLANPAPGEHGFTIKYDLVPEPGRTENIWVDVLSASPGAIIGRLANVPVDTRFKLGEKVTVTEDQIIDWGYMSNGVMQGNFTTRAMLPRYGKEEAEQIRKDFGW